MLTSWASSSSPGGHCRLQDSLLGSFEPAGCLLDLSDHLFSHFMSGCESACGLADESHSYLVLQLIADILSVAGKHTARAFPRRSHLICGRLLDRNQTRWCRGAKTFFNALAAPVILAASQQSRTAVAASTAATVSSSSSSAHGRACRLRSVSVRFVRSDVTTG
jgi:hypothetical protein